MKKIITLLFLLLILGCQKDYIDDIVDINFFDQTEQIVYNNQSIEIILPKDDTYSLLLVGIEGNLIARERFTGTKGTNKRTIYVSLLTDREEVYLMLYNNNGNKLEEVFLKLK